jgi:hypothetical protein
VKASAKNEDIECKNLEEKIGRPTMANTSMRKPKATSVWDCSSYIKAKTGGSVVIPFPDENDNETQRQRQC